MSVTVTLRSRHVILPFQAMSLFPIHYTTIEQGTIAYYSIGSGFPLLLLHGFPETHIAWHKTIEGLSKYFTVICPDLPGYGDSTWPVSNKDNFTKRNMAAILVSFMEQLGFDSFHLAGHDRGGRVAYRLALDHPSKVRRLAVLDIVPTVEVMSNLNYNTALEAHNWLFMAQPMPLPETLLTGQPGFYIDYIISSWAGRSDAIGEEIRAKYAARYSDPQVIHTVCQEYRATETDIEHDETDQQSNKRIVCPVLALWAESGFATKTGEPLDIWRKWATTVSGRALHCGHFLMEESPEEVTRSFIEFFNAA